MKKINVAVHHFPESVKALLVRAVRDTFAHEKVREPAEINLIMVSDPAIRKLNRKFRKVHRITDVISFRYTRTPLVSGDIYISEGRSKKQARRMKHTWERELAYLTVHGILHLFDYTDYTPKERQRMFSCQDVIWEKLFRS